MSEKQIQLTMENAEKILCTFVERAQNSKDRGSPYELSDADALVKSMTVLSGGQVQGLNRVQARQNLINGVMKGQKHGCYSLQDAASLWTVVGYIVNETRRETETGEQNVQMSVKQKDEDLSELSESVPLKPREI
jgi:hypothetical protein